MKDLMNKLPYNRVKNETTDKVKTTASEFIEEIGKFFSETHKKEDCFLGDNEAYYIPVYLHYKKDAPKIKYENISEKILDAGFMWCMCNKSDGAFFIVRDIAIIRGYKTYMLHHYGNNYHEDLDLFVISKRPLSVKKKSKGTNKDEQFMRYTDYLPI